MPKSPQEIVDEEIAQYRKEYGQAQVALQLISGKIQALEQLRSKLGDSSPQTSIQRIGRETQAEGGKPQIRSMVGEVLTTMREFSSTELVAAVQDRSNEAKDASIRAELSHRKGKGDVVSIEGDRYRSNLYRQEETQPEPPRRPPPPPLTAGDANGPKPGFGRIVP